MSDIANHANGRDLRITFDMASDESQVLQYKLLILKSADADTYTLAEAISQPGWNLAPNGNDRTFTFLMNTEDIDGDLIQEGVAYKAIVHTKPTEGYAHSLSAPSNEITLSQVNSIPDAGIITEVQISPNPAGHLFHVSAQLATDEKVDFTVTNVAGEVVYSDKLAPTSGKLEKQISLDDVAAGMYYINFETKKERVTKVLVLKNR